MTDHFIKSEAHERSFLLREMESLGLRAIRLNEFNNNSELRDLVDGIKGYFLKEHALQSE